MASILNGLMGATDRITGKPHSSGGGSYGSITSGDFTNTFTTALVLGSWIDVGEYVVAPQTEVNVGYGSAETDRTVGTWTCHLEDGAANAFDDGQLRIVTRNSRDQAVEFDINGVDTDRLDQSTPRDYFAVPEVLDTARVGYKSKVVLQANVGANSSASSIDLTAAASTFNLSITVY